MGEAMSVIEWGRYYWVRLKGSDEDDKRTWEPAYRFRAHGNIDVWLVIATSEEISDDRVVEVGPRLKEPK